MQRVWIILVVWSSLSMRTASAADAPAALVRAIDKLVERQKIANDEPGVAILIQQPGQLHFQKGYGLANLKTKQPITPRTMFELASVSKTFTATAVLILQERGQLSLDDDVRMHIPELPASSSGKTIRIRELLHHTSGLHDYMDFEDVPARHKTYRVNEDFAGMFASQKDKFPPNFPPRQKYEYNNSNYMLLGLCIARVTMTSYGTFLKQAIFDPAGMKHTFVYESPQSVPREEANGCNRAIGYEWMKKKETWREAWGAPPTRNEELLTVGDGGIWTNLEDMARWDTALRDGKLLKASTWKQALVSSRTLDGKTNGYGLGWCLYGEPDALNGYGHDGSWGGFETSYYRYLTGDRTTVILSNRSTFDTDKFWYALNRVVESQLEQ